MKCYIGLISYFPIPKGVLIVAALADTIGRKYLQGVGFIVMGLFYSLLFICTHR